VTKPTLIIGTGGSSLENQRDLALISLTLGETLHRAASDLGLARHHAAMIASDSTNPPATQERGREILRLIRDYGDELKRVRNLQADPPALTQTHLHSMLDDVAASDRFRVIRLKKSYQLADDSIVAPERQLAALLKILTQNAIDSMSPRETLTIETLTTEINGVPAIRVLLHREKTGATQDHQSTTSEMGLLWVRSFMRSYRGQMRVVTSDRGATTEVLLPRIFSLDLVSDENKGE